MTGPTFHIRENLHFPCHPCSIAKTMGESAIRPIFCIRVNPCPPSLWRVLIPFPLHSISRNKDLPGFKNLGGLLIDS